MLLNIIAYIRGQWLTRSKDREEARKVLINIRRVPESDPRIALELLEIKTATIFDRETREEQFPGVKGNMKLGYCEYKQIFSTSHLNKRLFIACFLQLLQQFTGMYFI